MAGRKMSLHDWLTGAGMGNEELKAIQELLDGGSLTSRIGYFADVKTSTQQQSYKDMVETGKGIHNLRAALGNYAKAASTLGFPNAEVISDDGPNGSKTYKIIFWPNVRGDLTLDDCPQLTISTRDGLGVGIDNHLPSIERLLAVRNQNGDVGLASAIAVGIDDATDELDRLARSSKFLHASDTKSRAKVIKVRTSKAMRAVTRSNPMISSQRSGSKHREAFDIRDRRMESVASVAGQVDWGYLFNSLYVDRLQRKGYDPNGPKSGLEFSRDVNKIFQDAAGVDSYDKFESLVRSKYPYYYKNYWKEGLGSAFKQVFSIGMVRGIKTEGAPNITSLFDVEIPGLPLVEKSSRKPGQNMMVHHHPGGAHRSGTNITHTRTQRALTKVGGKLDNALYYGGMLSDADLVAAYERFVKEQTGLTGKEAYNRENAKLKKLYKQYKFLGDFRKGINLDGSIYDAAIQSEFTDYYTRTLSVSKAQYDAEVKKIKEALSKSGKKLNASTIKKQAFARIAGLRPGEHIAPKGISGFDESGIATIITKGINDNGTFKGLGGGTSDFRSVLSPVMSELLGYAFEHAGYQKGDIYNKDGSLKMLFARQNPGKIETKKVFNEAMGMYYYMVNEMLTKKGMSPADIVSAINGGVGGDLLSLDSNGGLFFNNKSSVLNSPVKFLKDLGKLGQSQGIFAKTFKGYKGDIFEEKDGELYRRILTPMATEIMRTTILPWEGTTSKSRIHYGYREQHSLANTHGLMRAMGLDTTQAQAEAQALFRTLTPEGADPRYQSYVDNVKMMRSVNFNPQLAAQLSALKKKGALILTPSSKALQGLSEEGLTYSPEDGSVIADENYLNSPEYRIAQAKREHYAKLLADEGSAEAVLKKYGIGSADEVITAFNPERAYIHGDQQGGIFILPSGSATEPVDGMAKISHLDTIGASMVRGALDLSDALPSDIGAAYLFGQILSENQQKAADDILSKEGSIYKKYRQIEVSDSAYFMTQAAQSGLFDSNSSAYDPRYAGNVIMNPADYIDLLLRGNTEEGAADLQNKLLAKYKFMSKDNFVPNKRFEESNVREQNRILARAIASLSNVNSDKFVGAATGSIFNRFPTIRGSNDLLSPGVILDGRMVTRGNLAADPFLSLEAKQDNDADRIGLTSGLSYRSGLTVDQYYAAEREAAQRHVYFEKLFERQRKLGMSKFEDPGISGVAIEDLAKLSNLSVQLAQAQLVHSGKSLTGLYGDLLDGVNEALFKGGLTNASILDSGSDQAIRNGLASQILGGFLATAHQEAISAKKIEQDEAEMGAEEAATHLIERLDKLRGFNERMRSSSSWLSRESVSKLIDEGIKKGIFESDSNLFKTNVLAGVTPSTRSGMNYLAEMLGLKDTASLSDQDLEDLLLKTGIGKEAFLNILFGTGGADHGLNGIISGNSILQEHGITKLADLFGNNIYKFIPGKGIGNFNGNPDLAPDNRMQLLLSAIGKGGVGGAGGTGGAGGAGGGGDFPKGLLTLAEWAETDAAKWSKQYENALKSGEGDFKASPHGLLAKSFPLSSPSINAEAEEAMKRLMEDPSLTFEGLGMGNIQDIVTLLNSTLRGKLVHIYTEGLANVLKENDGKGLTEAEAQEELEKALNENPEYVAARDRLQRFLKASGLDDAAQNIEMSNVKARAAAQMSILASLDPKQIVGAETVMWGRHNNVSTTGVADLMYTSERERADGTSRKVLNVLDYKNTSRGTFSVQDMTQVLHYIADLKALQQDINNNPGISTADYLHGDSVFMKRWRESIDYQAGKLPEEEREQFLAEQLEKLTNTIDTLRGDTAIVGQLSYTNNTGAHTMFEFDPDKNPLLRGLIAKYNSGYQITKEDSASVTGAATEIHRSVAPGFIETLKTPEMQAYLDALKQQIELENKIIVLQERKNRLVASGRENEAADVQKDIDSLITTKANLESEVASAKTALNESNAAKFAGITDESVKRLVLDQQGGFVEDLKNLLKTALDQALQEERERAKKEDEAESIKYYKTNAPQQLAAQLRYNKLSRIVRDSTAIESPEERKAYREEMKELSQQLDETIADSVAQRLKSIQEYFLGEGSTASGVKKDEFNKLFGEFKKTRDDALREDTIFGDARYNLEKRKKLRQQRSEVRGVVTEADNAAYKVWELDQRISRESDSVTKQFLEKEHEALLELAQLAQDRVEELKAAHTNKKGVLDPHYQQLLDDEAKKSQLEIERRQNEYLSRQKAGNAPAMSGMLGGIGNQFALYFKRMFSSGLVLRLMARFRQEIQKLIYQAKELDRVMANVRIVTNGTMKETRELMSTYSSLGKELGATTREVAQSGIEWMRQGYDAAQTVDLVTASLYLSKLGMIDSTSATKNLTSALKGFKLEASEAMSVVDKLTAIDLRAATSAGDIAEGLAQFANLGSLAGVNIDQAAAYVATIADVTQMSGSSAGQALKTIISRYGNVKAGAYNKINVNAESTDTSENLNDVEKVLSKIGISIRNTNLEFKDFDEVLSEIAEKWNTLDNVSKKAIANAFAGIRQQESFVTLLENWEKYEELLETSRSSQGTAETKYTSYKDSLDASINRLTATLEDFVNRAEVSELIKGITDLATTLASWLPGLVKALPQIIAALANIRLFTGRGTLVTRLLTGDKATKFFGRIGDTYRNTVADYEEAGYGKKTGRFQGVVKTLFGEGRGQRKVRESREEKLKKAEEAKLWKEKLRLERESTLQSKYRLNVAKMEAKYKDDVKTAAVVETLKKGQVLTDAELESLSSKKRLTNAELSAMISSRSITSEQAIALYRKQGGVSEKQIERFRKQGAAAESSAKTKAPAGGGDPNVPNVKQAGKGMGAGAMASIAAAASYAITQVMATVSAYQTSGLTHKNEYGEEVQSSEEAHATGRTITTALAAAIPFFGGMIGELISDSVMKDIDRARDNATYQSNKSNASLQALADIKNDFNQLKNLAHASSQEDLEARNGAVSSYLNSMYSSENTEIRMLLQEYLPGIMNQLGLDTSNGVTLNSLMEQYQDGDEKTKDRIIKALEIAQKRVQITQAQGARLAEQYNYEQKIEAAQLQYNSTRSGYTQNGIPVGAEVGANAAGIAAGAGTGVAVGAGTAAIGGASAVATMGLASLAGPVGWIIGGIALIGGAIVGTIVGISEHEAKVEEEQKKAAQWNNKTINEKIDSLSEQEKLIREEIDNTGENEVDKLNDLEETLQSITDYKKVLQDYSAYIASENAKTNKLAIQEGLLLARDTATGNYLMDMGISELKGYHIEELYEMLADAVNASELFGMSTRDSAGNLTEEFIKMATQVMRTDAELASVLSGESLTLREAISKLDPNDRFESAILQNFATALNTSIDGLASYADSLGNLTLGDLLKSTTELSESVNSYNDLMTSIGDSTASTSEWMSTIIKQFPELIQYMGDMPTLMTAIVEKVHELSQRYVETQWEELAASTSFFEDTIAPDILNQFAEGEERNHMAEVLKGTKAQTMGDLRTWLMGQDLSEGSDAKKLYDAFANAGANYQLTSDIYKKFLSSYIETNVKLMEQEIDNLTQQRDMLQNINKQREYENRLLEARNKLEDAQNEKQRVYRAGVGWVYEANQEKIEEAQKGLQEVEREQDISKLTMQIETLTAYKDEWSNIFEKQNFELAQEQAEAFEKEFGVNGTLNDRLDDITRRGGLLDGIKTSVDSVTAAILGNDQSDKSDIITDLNRKWKEYQSAIGTDRENDALQAYTTAYSAAKSAGVTSGWSSSNNELENNGAATNGAKTADAYTVGEGGYEANKVNYDKIFALGGAGLTSTNGAEDISTQDADHIWGDMQTAAGKDDSDAARIWTLNNGIPTTKEGYKLGKKNQVDARLRISKNDENLYQYASRVNSQGFPELIIAGLDGDAEWAYLKGGRVLKMTQKENYVPFMPGTNLTGRDGKKYKVSRYFYGATDGTNTVYLDDGTKIDGSSDLATLYQKLVDAGVLQPLARGTLDFGGQSGLALINELGSEAMVTPQGTLTALPSHSGIVPADITKNLWALGEVAPNILRSLQMSILPGGFGSTSPISTIDESLVVNGLTMNVNADSTFDVRKFVDSLKQQAALTRNLK